MLRVFYMTCTRQVSDAMLGSGWMARRHIALQRRVAMIGHTAATTTATTAAAAAMLLVLTYNSFCWCRHQ